MMRKIKKSVSLCIIDGAIIFNLCSLEETIMGEEMTFRFEPNYQVIDLIPNDLFEGIQGIDLSLRKKEYLREGIPTFVSERIPPKNRIDLDKFLLKTGVDYYDPIELLLVIGKYSGDNIVALPFIENNRITINYSGNYKDIKKVLINIAKNNIVAIDNYECDPVSIFKALYPIYIRMLNEVKANQLKGVKTRIKNKTYVGRKKLEIKDGSLDELFEMFRKKQITFKELQRMTGWSRSTIYRRMKQLSQN